MSLAAPESVPAPGTCYRFVVESAEQAAALIRERLGENARVLSVRSVAGRGWRRLLSSPKLEVIAQLEVPAEAAPARVEITADETPAVNLAGRRPPDQFKSLSALLRHSGFSENLIRRLEAAPDWAGLAAAPLHRAFVEIGRRLCAQAESRPARPPLSRAAFLGAPGSGRSTALCKWLAAEVFRRARHGHVVTAEFDRPGTPGPLPVFCEALGVPLGHYPASTQPAITGGFVYFDLPGLSLRRAEDNASIRIFLAQEQITERVLVVNAAYEHAALRRAFAAGTELEATHVIFTHLDETPQWARLWDYVLESGLEPLFLSTGPSLTGDCETDAAQTLARRTLPNAG